MTASKACKDAFRQGHDDEAAGMDTFTAFRPSIQTCSSLDEWTAAARAQGVDLAGREPVFVDRTCNTADAETKARRICVEVSGADS